MRATGARDVPDRACNGCGRPFTPDVAWRRLCARCESSPSRRRHSGRSPNRDRAAQADFRRRVLDRDGYQCTARVGRERCPETSDLRACHKVPVTKGGGYETSNGETLCARHDRESDPHAR
jgi:hypothetical protein